MKIKNLNVRQKALSLLSLGVLTVGLTGCSAVDKRYTYNKAIVFGDSKAVVFELDKWVDYGGDRFEIVTKEGFCYLTSARDTKLVDDRNSSFDVLEFIHLVKGNDFLVEYASDFKKVK